MAMEGVVTGQGFAVQGVHGRGVAAVEDDAVLRQKIGQFRAGVVAVGWELVERQVAEGTVDEQARRQGKVVGGKVGGGERPGSFVNGDELGCAPKRP